MRQIWKLKSLNWVIPLSVEFEDQTDVAKVRIGGGIHLLPKMREEAESYLEWIGNKRGPHWWIPTVQLLKMAEPTDEAPEDVLRWNMPQKTDFKWRVPDGRSKKEIETNREEFENRELIFGAMVQAGFFNTPEEAEVKYNAFCKCMLDVLVNKQKFVDLGFCRLYPVPYRVNWKQILLQKTVSKIEKKRRKGKRRYTALGEVLEEFLNNQLLAYNQQSKVINWTLEVDPQDLWFKMVRTAELARKKYRKHMYWLNLVETLKRLLPYSIHVYKKFLAQEKYPWVRIHGRDLPSDTPFSEIRKQTGIPHDTKESPENPVAFDHKTSLWGKGVNSDLEKTPEVVHEMSRLREAREELRKTRKEMEQPGWNPF